MEPIALEKAGGGRTLVDPDEVASVDEFRGQSVVVTTNYQVYWVDQSMDQIQEEFGLKTKETTGGE